MTPKRWYLVALPVLIVMLLVTAGLAAAQDGGPGAERQALDPDSPDAHSDFIPVQGRLTDASGQALNGNYDVTFRFYARYSGGTALCETIKHLVIDDGLFSTFISGSGCSIDGRPLYLGVEVGSDGEMVPRMYIDNVPYAWTLRPGAVISDSLGSTSILHIENWGAGGRGLRSYAMSTSGANYGVVGASRSPGGYGGYFYNNGGGIGLYGQSSQVGGAGVLAEGLDGGADLILGGNENTTPGDDGVLASDPDYVSSDVVIRSNDNVRIDLDHDGDGEDADFEIRDRTGALRFDVDESGMVTFGGPGIAAFPRPAYDSGWVAISAGSTQELTHNLGGDADDYVVDLTCYHPSYGRHIWGLGADVTSGGFYGVFWKLLTNTKVSVERATNDGECPQVRVRIWMYP